MSLPLTVLLAQQGQGPELPFGTIVLLVVLFVALILILTVLAVFANFFSLWIQSFLTGANVTMWDLIGMYFRNVRAGDRQMQDHGRAGRTGQ